VKNTDLSQVTHKEDKIDTLNTDRNDRSLSWIDTCTAKNMVGLSS
jgi:hypothetical protein